MSTAMSSPPSSARTLPAGSLQLRPHLLDAKYQFLSLLVPVSHPHVVVVSLDRPAKLNAVNATMWRELGDCFNRIAATGDMNCRCVVLRGNGRAFCAGIDLSLLSGPSVVQLDDEAMDPARRGLAFQSKLRQMQAAFTAVETCPVPVIALLHGLCLGAGMDLACCASIRIAADPTTVFAVKEVQVGLAADVGTLQRLPHLVSSQSWVSDVCLTGRNFSAKEALGVGFVSRILQGDSNQLLSQALDQLCTPIARNSPVAVVGTKQALLYARDHTVADGLEQMVTWNALALQANDLPIALQQAAQGQKLQNQSLVEPVFSNLAPHARL